MSKIRVPTGHVHVGAGGGGGGGGDPEHEAQQDARITSVEAKANANGQATATLTTKVNGLGTRMSAVEAKAAQQDGRITGLTARDDAQEALIQGQQTELDDHEQRLVASAADNAGRDADIAALKASRNATNMRVTQTETKNIEQDGRLGTLTGQVAGVLPAVSSNTAAIDAVRLRVTDVEAKNVQQDGRIVQVENNRAGDLARIAENERKVGILDTRLGTIDVSLAGLAARADAADASFTAVGNRITAVEQAVAAVTNNLDQNYVRKDSIGVANGPASLDANGKLRADQIPDALLGALQYQGTWNAQTNQPPLKSSVGTRGQYYVVSVAGSTPLNGKAVWNQGDWAVFNGTTWDRVEGDANEIQTVNGKGPQGGNVTLGAADIASLDPYGLGKFTVQGQLDALASGAQAGGTDLDAIRTRLSSAENTIGNHATRIYNLETTVQAHGYTLQAHGDLLNTHEYRLNGLDQSTEKVANKGIAGGYAPLGPDIKIPIGFLPDAVIGGSKYRGTWDADKNQPPLSSGQGEEGAFYKVTVAGNTNLDGYAEWLKDDTAVFQDGAWSRIAGGVPIQSINGQQGIKVTLYAGNIPTAPGGAPGITVQAELDALNDRTTVVPTHTSQIASLTYGLQQLSGAAEYVSRKGQPNGYAPLDGENHVPETNLPAAVKGALSYQGRWDADKNNPPLQSSVGNRGWYYVVSVAGSTNLDDNASWDVTDWAVYNGTTWDRVANAGGVAVDGLKARVTTLEGSVHDIQQLDAAQETTLTDHENRLDNLESGAGQATDPNAVNRVNTKGPGNVTLYGDDILTAAGGTGLATAIAGVLANKGTVAKLLAQTTSKSLVVTPASNGYVESDGTSQNFYPGSPYEGIPLSSMGWGPNDYITANGVTVQVSQAPAYQANGTNATFKQIMDYWGTQAGFTWAFTNTQRVRLTATNGNMTLSGASNNVAGFMAFNPGAFPKTGVGTPAQGFDGKTITINTTEGQTASFTFQTGETPAQFWARVNAALFRVAAQFDPLVATAGANNTWTLTMETTRFWITGANVYDLFNADYSTIGRKRFSYDTTGDNVLSGVNAKMGDQVAQILARSQTVQVGATATTPAASSFYVGSATTVAAALNTYLGSMGVQTGASMKVNGQTITVVGNGAPTTATSVALSDTYQQLLAKIDALSGATSTLTLIGANGRMSLSMVKANGSFVIADAGGSSQLNNFVGVAFGTYLPTTLYFQDIASAIRDPNRNQSVQSSLDALYAGDTLSQFTQIGNTNIQVPANATNGMKVAQFTPFRPGIGKTYSYTVYSTNYANAITTDAYGSVYLGSGWANVPIGATVNLQLTCSDGVSSATFGFSMYRDPVERIKIADTVIGAAAGEANLRAAIAAALKLVPTADTNIIVDVQAQGDLALTGSAIKLDSVDAAKLTIRATPWGTAQNIISIGTVTQGSNSPAGALQYTVTLNFGAAHGYSAGDRLALIATSTNGAPAGTWQELAGFYTISNVPNTTSVIILVPTYRALANIANGAQAMNSGTNYVVMQTRKVFTTLRNVTGYPVFELANSRLGGLANFGFASFVNSNNALDRLLYAYGPNGALLASGNLAFHNGQNNVYAKTGAKLRFGGMASALSNDGNTQCSVVTSGAGNHSIFAGNSALIDMSDCYSVSANCAKASGVLAIQSDIFLPTGLGLYAANGETGLTAVRFSKMFARPTTLYSPTSGNLGNGGTGGAHVFADQIAHIDMLGTASTIALSQTPNAFNTTTGSYILR